MQEEDSASPIAHHRGNLLDQLRLKIFEAVTGNGKRLPSDLEVQQYVLNYHRENPSVGDVLISLLTIQHIRRCSYASLPAVGLTDLLDNLEDNPWPNSRFLEIYDCPSPMPRSLGVLVEAWPRNQGGHAYILTCFDKEQFPRAYAGRAEVSAYRGQRRPFAGVLVGPGEVKWYNADEDAWKSEPLLQVTLAAISFLHHETPPHYLAISEAKHFQINTGSSKMFRAPRDPMHEALLAEVQAGRARCYRTRLPTELVIPYSFTYCMLYPLEIVRTALRSFRVGKFPEILVYAKNGRYVMSDDYSTYLAYRGLRAPVIPAVVMGEFPDADIYPYEAGGNELYPDLGLIQLPDYDRMDENVRELLLEQRMRRELLGEDNLEVLRSFHELLAESDIPERRLHEFLRRHPMIIDPSGVCLMSEVSLGPYRADLVIEVAGDHRSITLIELERSTHRIFTKGGRLRASVVHAIQQVEDWLQWWRENPTLLPIDFDARIPPEGLVVIGRSIELSEEEKRRISHLNHNRRVKLCTYDDLAARFEQLILHLKPSLSAVWH